MPSVSRLGLIRSLGLFLSALLLAACPSSMPPPSETEILAAERQRMRTQFDDSDTDSNGLLSGDEAFGAFMLENGDRNGDNALDFDEYAAWWNDPTGTGKQPLPESVLLTAGLPYADGAHPRQRVDVYVPAQRTSDTPLAVVAYVHGGAWRMGNRIMARRVVPALLSSGRYAVVSIGYRLSDEASFPAQIHDVKAGLRWIRAHAAEYGLDPERVCIMGHSAGGHLAALAGTTNGLREVEGEIGPSDDQSSDVQCAIDFYGRVDVGRAHPPTLAYRSQFLGGAPEERPETVRLASPLYQVKAGDPPFLIVHGNRDPVVPFWNSEALDAALREAGVPVWFQTVDGGGHGDFASPEIDRRVQLFLDRVLQGERIEIPTDPILHEPSALQEN